MSRTRYHGIVLFRFPNLVTWWLAGNQERMAMKDRRARLVGTLSGGVGRAWVSATFALQSDGLHHALAFLSRGEVQRLNLSIARSLPTPHHTTWRYSATGDDASTMLEFVQNPHTGHVIEFLAKKRLHYSVKFGEYAQLGPDEKCPFSIPDGIK